MKPASPPRRTRLGARIIGWALIAAAFVASPPLVIYAYARYCRATQQKVRFVNKIPWVRSWLLDEKYLAFAGEVQRLAHGGGETFATTWDFNQEILLSRELYQEVVFEGKRSYRPRPNLRARTFQVWTGLGVAKVTVPDSPELARWLDSPILLSSSVSSATDAFGFRNTGVPVVEGMPAVFLLGDSFTEGYGVSGSETFTRVLYDLLRQGHYPVTPIDMGVNGYSVLEMLGTYEMFHERFRPRVVVANLFPNDVEGQFEKVLYGEKIDAAAYARMFADLGRLKAECEKDGARLLVAVITARQQLFDRRATRAFQEQVLGWCRREGVPFLDPSQELEKAGKAAYLRGDAHLSPAGHRVYGRFLFKALEPVLKDLRDSVQDGES
jgi:lysophospholipase L1-like esterase